MLAALGVGCLCARELIEPSRSRCTPGGFAAFSLKKHTPGNLTAVGQREAGGQALASHTLLTAGEPAAVVLSVDVPSIATGTGAALVTKSPLVVEIFEGFNQSSRSFCSC